MNRKTSPMFICKIGDGEPEYKIELEKGHKLKLIKKTKCTIVKGMEVETKDAQTDSINGANNASSISS